ncbi:MAG: hypothetical protein IPJ88_05575 [Myxococcales bacterium]|nr:MAG: hypothetical protein IPJ88_05575 [Myxococcales bacterium]
MLFAALRQVRIWGVITGIVLWAGCGLGQIGVPGDSSEANTNSSGISSSDDAAFSDAGTMGTGTTDTGQGSSPGNDPNDPCGNAWFCDDFENASSGGAPDSPWQSELVQSTISIDSAQSYSGSQSVHVKTSSNQSYTRGLIRFEDNAVLPVAGNHFFARAMMYIKAVPDAYVHWTLVEAAGPVENENFSARYRFGGQNYKRFLANYWTEPTNVANTDCWQHSDDMIVEGQWQCFEWEFDGPNNREQMWVNGQAVNNMNVQDHGQGCLSNDLGGQWLAPQFTTLSIGWGHYQQSNMSHELWIDDVVISGQAIGCPE